MIKMSNEKYIVPENLYYTKEHEWLKIDNTMATVGITDYAQKALHEIVFVDLPEVGKRVKQMEPIGTVESVKAVSEIYTPISGKIIQINDKLTENPEFVNQDPYGKGWIAKIQPENINEEIKNLMDSKAYRDYLKTLEQTE